MSIKLSLLLVLSLPRILHNRYIHVCMDVRIYIQFSEYENQFICIMELKYFGRKEITINLI